MRTQEQIIADCEARYEELKKEKERRDNDRTITHPCSTCKWLSFRWEGYEEGPSCNEPLVVGFGEPVLMGRGKKEIKSNIPRLCGPEKALWQPKEEKPREKPPLWFVSVGVASLIFLPVVIFLQL